MSFFKEVEGEAAVLVENGVYRQVPLYTRDVRGSVELPNGEATKLLGAAE